MPGGPGRPAGSRNKLTEYFLGDMLDAWGRREVATLNGHSVPNLLPLPWRTADDARALLAVRQRCASHCYAFSSLSLPCSSTQILHVISDGLVSVAVTRRTKK